MSIQEKLQQDLEKALRARDEVRKAAIRYIRSEIRNQELSERRILDDKGVISVLSRQARQRRESIEAFRQGNRQDLVDKEEAELAIIVEYLPEQMTEGQITSLAQRAIEEVGATGPADMGRVMGRVMPEVKGKADGQKVREVVSNLLQPSEE